MVEHSKLDSAYINKGAVLPYDLKIEEVEAAVAETYRMFYGINDFLAGEGYRPLEELILANSLSGIVSEFLVKNIAKCSEKLEANIKVGGHPDLLPHGLYDSNEILKGSEGIEIKASIQKGGWQGHNPEDCWIMVFRYRVGKQTDSTIVPLTFTEILCAQVLKSDCSFSGRKGESRRTPTASITSSGVEKLRSNFLYRLPGVGIGRHKKILAGN